MLLPMKNSVVFIVLLFCLFGNSSVLFGQETRMSGTLKMHPWVTLPVVVSTDVQGGMQSLGKINLSAMPANELNTAIPVYKRDFAMVVSVVDATKNDQIRSFEYQGNDVWREVFMVHQWQAGRDYHVGESVAYSDNFYVANVDLTSNVNFENDSVKWNAWGGKDAKYDISEIVMDGDTLTKVARKNDVVNNTDINKTLATVGFVNGALGSSTFNANRIVTRTGLDGITGQNYNTSTVTDFLDKLFFPVLGPVITLFSCDKNTLQGQFSFQTVNPTTKVVNDNIGSVTFPYSAWSNTSVPNLVFDYALTKRDVACVINSVELFNGASSLGSLVTDGALSGSIQVPKANFTNADVTKTITLTLKVTYDVSNVSSLDFTASFTKANGVTISNAHISTTTAGPAFAPQAGGGTALDPYLIERTGHNQDFYLVWTMNGNDDVGHITNIDFTGNGAPSDLEDDVNLIDTYSAVTFPNSDVLTVYHIGASAKGSVANDVSSVSYSSYYRLQDKTYCGFLGSNLAPSESDIKALTTSSLKTTTFYDAAGVSYTNNSYSSGYFTWAIPTYVAATAAIPSGFSKTVYYEAAGTWFQNTNINSYYVALTPPGGGAASWYWVCIYNASIGKSNSIKVKISDN